MNWNDIEKEFAEYDKEIPCVICKKPAKPTVTGGNFKCWDCGHLFREDGTKPAMDCHCKKCAPAHDPLKGKTKGKKAELDLDDRVEEEKPKKKKILRRKKNKRSGN